MEKKEFKVLLNSAVLYFEVFYIIYIAWMILDKRFQEALVISVVGVFVIGYLFLFRPVKYTVDRKLLLIHKRLGKAKEINLMTCQTISDPVPKMTRLVTNPRGLEIYTEGKKRYMLVPKDKVGFVEAVAVANKRIHIQVDEYASLHKSHFRKQRKKARKENKDVD